MTEANRYLAKIAGGKSKTEANMKTDKSNVSFSQQSSWQKKKENANSRLSKKSQDEKPLKHFNHGDAQHMAEDKEHEVVSFLNNPTMPAPYHFEAGCGAWEVGECIAIMGKNPAYICEDMFKSVAGNAKVTPFSYPKKYGIRHHYVMVVYWKPEVCKMQTARPAAIKTFESVNVRSSYWDAPMLCTYSSSVKWGGDSVAGGLTEEVAREKFLATFKETPRYIGTSEMGAKRVGREFHILSPGGSGCMGSLVLCGIVMCLVSGGLYSLFF